MFNIMMKIRRTPIRFMLFVIVFAMVAALLNVGLNLSYIARKNKELTKNEYNVIAVIQSDSINFEKHKEEYEILKKLPYVSIYEPVQITGYSASITLSKESYTYGFNKGVSFDWNTNQALMINQQMVIIFTYQGDEMILIEDCLYGDIDCKGAQIHVDNLSSNKIEFEKGEKYIAYGKIGPDMVTTFTNNTMQLHQDNYFQIYDYVPDYYIDDSGKRVIDNYFGYQGIYNAPPDVLSYSVEQYDNRSDYWNNILGSLELSKFPVTIMSVKDVESICDFHQEKAWMMSGEPFAASDYKEGAYKCMIDYNTAQSSGLKVGDKIDLILYISSLVYSNWSLSPTRYSPSHPNYWANVLGETEFEIVGIFEPLKNFNVYEDSYYTTRDQMILVPDQTMQQVLGRRWMEKLRIGGISYLSKYSNVVIDPEYTKEFVKEVLPMKELTAAVYDEGKYSIDQRIELYQMISRNLLAITSALGILAIGGFAYFTYRLRKKDAKLMYLLGDSKVKIIVEQLILALFIVTPASLLGGAVSNLLSPKIIDNIQKFKFDIDVYSYFIKGNVKAYEFDLNMNAYMIFVVAAVLSILVLLSVMIGAARLTRGLKSGLRSRE